MSGIRHAGRRAGAEASSGLGDAADGFARSGPPRSIVVFVCGGVDVRHADRPQLSAALRRHRA